MVRSRLLLLRNNICRWNSTNSNMLTAEIPPLQKSALAEKCIVVDTNDRPVGAASKFACHRVRPDGSLILHRAFSVFLFNNNGEILLQKRAPGKVTFPGHITNACCSHPLEDFPEERQNEHGVKIAAKRRLHYELGIPLADMNINEFHYLTRIHYKSSDDQIWGEHEIDYILFLQKDLRLNPNEDEVSEIVYVSKNTFPKYLASLSDPLTPWFRLIVKNYLSLWWDHLDDLKTFEDHESIKRF